MVRKGVASAAKGLAMVLAIGVVVLVVWLTHYRMIEMPRRELVTGARVGMSRSEVVRRLGSPKHVALSLKDLRDVGSFAPRPTTPVEKEILEYYRGFSWKLYVYVDKSDRVSKVIVSKT
jgi:hypothetical protein